MMTLPTAVCCQVIRLSSKYTPSSLKKRFFHFSSAVKNYQPEIRFDVSKKKTNSLKLKDRVPENYDLIYKAPMEMTFKIAYPTVMLATVAITTTTLYLYFREKKLELRKDFKNIKFANPSFELCGFLVVTCLFAVGTMSLLFKFPFRIYKHNAKQEYIAMFLSTVPPMLRQFRFNGVTKTHFKNPFYKIMDEHHYYLDKKKGFVMAHYFRVPADLFEMMGKEKEKYSRH